ncbi:hypothetical protein FSP39_011598 [Pinctada imbricata]|uniref:B box-type domain-containing protein n=1 Tax=Pinctada imbricata TaxID=66713 RepID=A0AA89BX27_PINIB|nr:hypothetical protein FSP39_011598 [Pinctada imbricata]
MAENFDKLSGFGFADRGPQIMSFNGSTSFPTLPARICGLCCGTSGVKWFCKSCAVSMCSICKTLHPTIPVCKNHVVVPHTNDVIWLYRPSNTYIAEHCKIYPEKEISTYCKDCQVPCCVTCQVQKHNRHDISTIEDAYLSAETGLKNNVKKLDKEMIPTLYKMAYKTRQDQSESRDKFTTIRDEVKPFRKMNQAMDKSYDVPAYTMSPIRTFHPSIIDINKVASFSIKFDATSINIASNNTAWVTCHDSDTMFLYDSNGIVLRSITIKERRGSPTTQGCSTHSKIPKHPCKKHRTDTHRKRRKRDKEHQSTTKKHET